MLSFCFQVSPKPPQLPSNAPPSVPASGLPPPANQGVLGTRLTDLVEPGASLALLSSYGLMELPVLSRIAALRDVDTVRRLQTAVGVGGWPAMCFVVAWVQGGSGRVTPRAATVCGGSARRGGRDSVWAKQGQ